MWARLALLPAIALLGVAASPAQAAGPTKPCPDDRSAHCGSVLVPRYRAAPDGGACCAAATT